MEESFGFVDKNNMGLFTDFYELTMAASYFENNMQDYIATFDLFFRKLPKNRNYLILAGVEQVIKYILELRFNQESIEYLSNLGFKDEFLKYLSSFKFNGDVYAINEGSVVFQKEPVIRVTAPVIHAQLIETFLLNSINLQTTIASKASRIVYSAKGRPIIEFGLRRTQGYGGVLVARASFIGGCSGTSNVLAGIKFGIPVFGTMAHSYIMVFENEKEAFRSFAKTFPKSTTLLIDTFNSKNGIENAIKIAKEMERGGKRLRAIRLDSGDFVKISKMARRMLDKNGLGYVRIFASGNLNEYKIDEMLKNGACIDFFGVGTDMSVSYDSPCLDVVYKLSEIELYGERKAKMKFSENKQTLPGRKQVFRQISNGKYIMDIITLDEEKVEGKPLLERFIKKGELVKKLPTLEDIRMRAINEVNMLEEKYKDIRKRYQYPVMISSGIKKLIKELKIGKIWV